MSVLSRIIGLILVFIANLSFANGYISEIINNTDLHLVLEHPAIIQGGCKSFKNVQIITNRANNERMAPYVVNDKPSLIILPRTKNIVIGLEIPCTTVDLQGDPFSLKFSTQDGSPQLLLAFRQFGDLFQITKKDLGGEVRDLILNGTKINVAGVDIHDPKTTGIKIIDGAYYSIEVNQVIKKVWHKNPGGYDFLFRKIEPPAQASVQFASSAKAVIKYFSPGTYDNGVTAALIGFEEQTTPVFFQKFSNLVTQDKYIKSIATFDPSDRCQEIGFKFYVDITRDDFQKILDALNLAAK